MRGPPRGRRVRAGCLPLLQPEILLEGRPPTTLASSGDMWAAGGRQGCHCPAAGPAGVRAVKPPASPGGHPGPATGAHLVETAASTPPPNGHHPAPRGPNHRPWTRLPPHPPPTPIHSLEAGAPAQAPRVSWTGPRRHQLGGCGTRGSPGPQEAVRRRASHRYPKDSAEKNQTDPLVMNRRRR